MLIEHEKVMEILDQIISDSVEASRKCESDKERAYYWFARAESARDAKLEIMSELIKSSTEPC